MAPLKTRSRNGFSLLEILITIVLLAMVAVGILWAINIGLFARSDVESVAKALNISQAKMEEIRNAPFANISNSGPAADAAFPTFSTTVNASNNSDIKQVDVTVGWATKGGNTNITLTTLVANY